MGEILDPRSAIHLPDLLLSDDGDPRAHIVAFYDQDEHLCDVAARFLAQSMSRGGAAVAIVDEPHERAILERLAGIGVDAAEAVDGGQLIVANASETLGRVMDGSSPDRGRFEAVVGALVDQAAAFGGGSGVRVFGEMVDVLWHRGNAAASLQIEELWSELGVSREIQLLCGYVLSNFYRHGSALQHVCAVHSHVLRDGAPVSTIETEHDHVQALAGEIAQRVEIERTLRETVRELRVVEEHLRGHVDRTERLVRVSAAVADAVTPGQVFEAVVDQVAALLRASSAGLWMTSPEDNNATGVPIVRLLRAVGYPPAVQGRFDGVPLDDELGFPPLDVLRSGEPLRFRSQEELILRYPHLASVAVGARPYRFACHPIRIQGRVAGCLGFSFDSESIDDAEEQSVMLLVARYSGQALERLALLESERRSRLEAERVAARSELLYRLVATANSSDSTEPVFQAALSAIEQGLGAHRSSILAFDPDGIMRFKAWHGLSAKYRAAVEGHSPWTRETRNPEPIFVADARQDPAMATYRPIFEAEGIGALGFFPLVAGGRLIGKFMVYYDRVIELSRSEIDLARAIADNVAASMVRFEAVDVLKETVRFHETFTGILGHDLRNPLAAIMTAAQLVIRRGDSDRNIKPLSRILSSGERMSRMIDQLLDFTRVRVGGGIALVPGPLDVVPLVRQCMTELDDANPEWTLRLEQTGDTEGTWDEDRLSQVFSNLVANAVQHGDPAYGVHVRVDGTNPTMVSVEVHNGGAVPETRLSRLFEPFAGGQRRRDKSEGLGLGLYITHEIVRAHGGRIELASSETEGTTFRVVLPRHVTAR